MDQQAVYEQVQREFACEHAKTLLTKLVTSNGASCYRIQCQQCGVVVSTPKKTELTRRLMEDAPPFDEALKREWVGRRQERYNELVNEVKETEDLEWREKYSRYLETSRWRAKRDLVFKRSRGMCEGCGLRPAVQAHHLTYARVGREMLFDLAAVCMECHREIHAK